MIGFIKLTIWSTVEAINGTPIWINPEAIRAMGQTEQRPARTNEQFKIPVKDRPAELVTWLMLGDGDNSTEQVQETPEEIVDLIAVLEEAGS